MRRILIGAVVVACGSRSQLDGAPPIDASHVETSIEDADIEDAGVEELTPDVADASPPACAFDGGALPSQTILGLGMRFGCAAVASGAVKCFGQNDYGELGNGTTQGSDSANAVVGLASASSVAVGDRHACALLTDGSVKCWGANEGGQVTPVVSNAVPTPTSPGTLKGPAVQLVAGSGFTCARLACDGGVECWGSALGASFATPQLVPSLATAIDLATYIDGDTVQVLARDGSGDTWCWEGGALTFGADCLSPKFTDVGLGNDVTEMAFLSLYPEKGAEPCVVTSQHELRCEPGYFAADDAGGFTLPMQGVSRIAIGSMSLCWLFQTGLAQCWRYDYGLETLATSDVVDLAAGTYGLPAMAVFSSGQVGYGGGFVDGIP